MVDEYGDVKNVRHSVKERLKLRVNPRRSPKLVGADAKNVWVVTVVATIRQQNTLHTKRSFVL